jgi:hypothetical protein
MALPSSAFGQATRTWVSGVGDDVNPCSRTAPCKTFAGAISKTAPSGEINCLDPGGFGVVTITKSIMIDCRSELGGVLAAGTNGIIINAGVGDRIILRGLDIDGAGSGLNGIRVLAARAVKIRDTTINGFTGNGVDWEASTSTSRGFISNSEIFGNTGNGVLVAPPAGGNSRVTIRRTEIDDNGCGATASSFVPSGSFASNCGVSTTAAGGQAVMLDLNNAFTNSAAAGIFANGPNAAHRIGGNEVFANFAGLVAGAGGAILSFGDNYVAGNTTDGDPTGPVAKK